ncbi:UDP-N-acetylmuramoyl-L-alanine--D-glutamate ligase [Marinospirillum sp.]|uniref:UDP-N-acetylmuramoyl-L-alanine--D-glutamate ligase n=1 Tax=Marinospirillum sp. TaxID=2183934 RepID=UPI003A89BC92
MASVSSAASYLVIGLGQTGLAVADYLQRQGLRFAVADTRQAPPGLAAFQATYAGVDVRLGPLDADYLKRFTHLVVSPGLSIHTPEIVAAREAGVEVLGDIELFCQAAQQPIIAITGSNGKTTVTTLIGAMIQACGYRVAVGGNIGIPALSLLTQPTDFYVLELSSFQLETLSSLRAQVALLLNISEDHLDRYPDMAAYVQAKQAIFRGCAVAVYNRQDGQTEPASSGSARRVSFGLDAPVTDQDVGVGLHQGKEWLMQGQHPCLPVDQVQLAGLHGRSNALAALACGLAAGLPLEGLLRGVRQFVGLPHRCQKVAELAGVRYYNDSKATNIGAVLAAVQGLQEEVARLWLILGGEGKGQDFDLLKTGLAQACAEGKIAGVALIGRDAPQIKTAMHDLCACVISQTLDQAVLSLSALAQPGDAVVLSPACASFDQFSGYQQRGEVFVQCVQQLSI